MESRRQIHAVPSDQEKRHLSKFRRFLRHVPFLNCLSESEIEALEQVVTERKYARGEVVLLEEDASRFLYIVYSGKIKVVRIEADGKEHMLAIRKRGDFFGEMGIMDGKTSPATFLTMEESEVALISGADFEKHLLNNPAVLRVMVRSLCDRLREAWMKVKVLSFTDAESRIRAVLELIAREHGVSDQRGTVIAMKLTHRDIARYSSLSRETVTRQLLRLIETDEIEVIESKRILLKADFFEHRVAV